MTKETQEYIHNSLTKIAEHTLQMLEAKPVLTEAEQVLKDDVEQILSYSEAHYKPNESDGFFSVLRLHRDDFEHQGYDASNVTDDQMQRIADKIGEANMESFWCGVDFHAEDKKLLGVIN